MQLHLLPAPFAKGNMNVVPDFISVLSWWERDVQAISHHCSYQRVLYASWHSIKIRVTADSLLKGSSLFPQKFAGVERSEFSSPIFLLAILWNAVSAGHTDHFWFCIFPARVQWYFTAELQTMRAISPATTSLRIRKDNFSGYWVTER